ncbi:hypothetical protein D9757_008956 [Collybiopsis confluens]|uniref:Sacsin/Nov domain-containing protein n=1 Tax=Collybiopsis confluens TaxID=2823264 RepID=A0A8H5HFB0_9AGAR|nr:hypothetical protein D9757_008956 [Collybiopsis confluens]
MIQEQLNRHGIFTLDCRQHGNHSVIEDALKRTQGPSLLAVNDSVFTDSDWVAVRTIHGSSKTADETKTGKYGLGIRACYHITDNIHILSGDKLVVFDPHEEFQKYEGGVSISLTDEAGPYQHQIDAFSGATTEIPFKGTVLRLPFRTAAEAQRSRIQPMEVTIDHIRELYQGFIENELSVALLFLKHILSIELREIAADGTVTVKAKVNISNLEIAPLRSFVPGRDSCFEDYRLDIVSSISTDSLCVQSWRIVHVVDNETLVKSKISRRLGYDVEDRLKKDKLSSHIALAFPLSDQEIRGQLFTLLPLPIFTNFPLHVHGVLALTPDRQNLRNPNELGIGAESRERLLVTWNGMVFEDFLPAAWFLLLVVLVEKDGVRDFWSAWPPADSPLLSARNVLTLLMNDALESDETIFLAKLKGSEIFVGSSRQALAAHASSEQALIRATSLAGVPVINPPAHIFDAFEHSNFRKDQKGHIYSFDHNNLHKFLQLQMPQLEYLGDEDKDCILEYLISVSPLYIIGLPLIKTVGGDRVSLSSPSAGRRRYTLATAAETELFRFCDPTMINISVLPSIVSDKLKESYNHQHVNVTDFDAAVMSHLLAIHSSTLSPSPDIAWFCAFWTWMDSLPAPDAFFTAASPFPVLPMFDHTVRKVSAKGFLIPPDKQELFRVLLDAKVPFVHPLLTSTSTLQDQDAVYDIDDFLQLINFLQPSGSNHEDRLILQRHLIPRLQTRPVMNAQQKTAFSRLPVFPTRIPGSPFPTTELNPATSPRLLFVDVTDDFPLPILNNAIFIDVSKDSSILASAIKPSSAKVLREKGVLTLAAENISTQPEFLQDILLPEIIRYITVLSRETQQKLRKQKCIPAAKSRARSCPADIIDPQSSLAALYHGENNRFPADPYSGDNYLRPMRSANLLCTHLSSVMLNERIKYLSATYADAARLDKARKLLDLLSTKWDASYISILQTDDRTGWVPTDCGTLAPRQQCRDVQDGEHHFLFDQVLFIAARPISTNLRNALGWGSAIDFDTLEQQLLTTLNNAKISYRADRLSRLIQYMAKQYSEGHLSSAQISILQDTVGDREWIPLSRSLLARTRYIILAEVSIGSTFQCAPANLREESCIQFLQAMGCHIRPTIDALIDVLSKILRKPILSLSEGAALLSELSSRADEIDDSQRESILVPDSGRAARKISEIYYNDMGDSSEFGTWNDDRYPLNPFISKMVAQSLHIPSLSSLQLDDDDDLNIDDEDMSESFVTRIRNTLVEYDVQYSFNEFLANASDAKASHFQVFLDTKICSSTRVLCPEMKVFQTGPALTLSNNALFSEDDFKGIRRIGEGGKQLQDDSIGKFGLGALSFYHFSEVVFIISGRFIMILDPSASYLPKRQQNARRSIWCDLKGFRRKYGGHLEPLYGLNGFSADTNFYNGTLIRLPLRGSESMSPSCLSKTPISFSVCRDLITGTYQELANNALFFTSLRNIDAYERQGSDLRNLWSVAAENIQTDDDGSDSKSTFTLRRRPYSHYESSQQQWLVIKHRVPISQVPTELVSEVQRFKATIHTSLAFCLGSSDSGQLVHHLFSGVRLPEVISIPAHFDSAFAIASDRRSIRFDPPDGDGRRTLQSKYNAWLLSDAFPALYFRGLQSLLQVERLKWATSHYWPKKAKDPISKMFSEAFYYLLPTTTVPVLRSVTGDLIRPEEALISSAEPLAVRELLTLLNIPNFVDLGAVTPYLPTSELCMLEPESLATLLRQINVEEALQILFDARRDQRSIPMGKLATQYRQSSASVQSAWEMGPHALKRFASMIDSTLAYIIMGEVKDGYNLLLLVTDDLVLRRFNDTVPIYWSPHKFSNKLFPESRFLSGYISEATALLLVKTTSYGVQNFDSQTVLAFVQHFVGNPSTNIHHPDEIIEWIDLFWKTFPKLTQLAVGLKIEHLQEYPLFPTLDACVFVSMVSCHSGAVLPDAGTPEMRAIMAKLGISVLREHPSIPLDDERLKFSFQTFLRCLLHYGQDPFQRLEGKHADWLAKWIVRQMTYLSHLERRDLEFLATLPLWDASRDGVIQRISANEIRPLPSDITLSRINSFLDANQSIGQYSLALRGLWSALRDDRSVARSDEASYKELSAMLRIPSSLPRHDIEDYKYLLRKLVAGGVKQLKVPDGRLVLRNPEELFDNSIPLFSAAFHHHRDFMFVHREFEEFQSRLSVQRSVTIDVFQRCAQEISNDQVSNQHDEILTRAATVYDYYNHQLPRMVTFNKVQLASLDNISFIPRNTAPWQDISYDSAPYLARLFSPVVSPDDLLREEHRAVAWTQRCKFAVAPEQNLITVYPGIGVPTAEDVVAHLLVLTNQAAHDHAHDWSLIRDLKATYKWLQNNQNAAQSALQGHQHESIFLNVDDIDDNNEQWRWNSAQELVLNLKYDSGRFFVIQAFLYQFRSLLLVAGVRERTDVTVANEAVLGDQDFQRLRVRGALLDIELRPEHEHRQDDELMGIRWTPSRLKAHAAYLAAHVPHIQDALTGWKEGTSRVLEFPGTYFGACAFLDILYTGDIPDERPQNDDFAMELLRNLLELLPVADRWDLPLLRKKLGWLITTKYLFIQPETLSTIREQAEEYHATELIKACGDFAQKNADILE